MKYIRLLNRFISWIYYLGMAFLAYFTLENFALYFNFTMPQGLLFLGSALILLSAFVIYDDNFTDLLTKPAKHAPQSKLMWLFATDIGIVSSIGKGATSGIAVYSILLLFVATHPLLATISLPAALAVGVCTACMQMTRLIDVAHILFKASSPQAQPLKWSWDVLLAYPLTLGHALGQFSPACLCVFLALSPIIAHSLALIVSLVIASCVALTTGIFYGKVYLFGAQKPLSAPDDIVYHAAGTVLGHFAAMFKGALAIVGMLGAPVAWGVLTATTIPAWLYVLAGLIGLSTYRVQSTKMVNKTLHMIAQCLETGMNNAHELTKLSACALDVNDPPAGEINANTDKASNAGLPKASPHNSGSALHSC